MRPSRESTTKGEPRASPWLWLGPLFAVLLMGGFFAGRYGGQWAESDSAAFAGYIRAVVQEGRLIPVEGAVYPNGFAYQALSAFIVDLAGLDVATLQQRVYPLLAALLVLPAWALYREWTGSARGATIATAILFVQPEFLFVILRSSHEKFTRLLLLLCLFWLTRGLRYQGRLWGIAAQVGLFYLTAFALIASNSFLAHAFLLAVAVAGLLGLLLTRLRPIARDQLSPLLNRIPYIVLISLAMVYLVLFYLYTPSLHDLFALADTWDRIIAMVLNRGTRPANVFAAVTVGWISPPVYFLVSIANWITLAASVAIWLYQGRRWFRRGDPPGDSRAWFLWLLYAAFAAQGVLALLPDAGRALGSNLLYRAFPSVSVVAAGLIGAALGSWRPRPARRLLPLALAAGLFGLSTVSILKAANEPMLSNRWTFYRQSELIALNWGDGHLKGADVWTGFDERLMAAFALTEGTSSNGNRLRGGDVIGETTRTLLVSDTTRLRSSRLGRALPISIDALRVYDNGEAELYHRRPVTPYQR